LVDVGFGCRIDPELVWKVHLMMLFGFGFGFGFGSV